MVAPDNGGKSDEKLEVEYTCEEKRERLDQFIDGLIPSLSRTQIKKFCEGGQAEVNGRVAKASERLKLGDKVRFIWQPHVEVTLSGESIELQILFEDSHLLVVDKPAGMVVHPSPGHMTGTLVHGLLGHTELSSGTSKDRPGIVHRIDKDTSGILVVAKNDLAHVALAGQFRDKTAEREYIAFAAPVPRHLEGTFNTKIARHPRNRIKYTSKVTEGKQAITHYRVLATYGGENPVAAQIVCTLETGRTHQIRVHCSDAGHPIIGDQMYSRGNKKEPLRTLSKTLGRQALHAAMLGFSHPATNETLRFESPLPPDLAALKAGLEQLESP